MRILNCNPKQSRGYTNRLKAHFSKSEKMYPFKFIIYLKFQADFGYFIAPTVDSNKDSNVTEF